MRQFLMIGCAVLWLVSPAWSHDTDRDVLIQLRERIWVASLRAGAGDEAGAVSAAEDAQGLWCDLSRHARRDILEWYPETERRLDQLPEEAAARARSGIARTTPAWYPGYRDPHDLFGSVDL